MSLEAADVLREWSEVWHDLYLQRDQGKFNQLKNLLTSTWHPHRKSFTLLEGVTLLGYLEHAALVPYSG